MSKENEQIKELQARVHNLEQALTGTLLELSITLSHLNESYSDILGYLSHSSRIEVSTGMIDIEEGK